MDNHENEMMKWLRTQLEWTKMVRDALLEEAQQMDVIAEAIELLLGSEPHQEGP